MRDNSDIFDMDGTNWLPISAPTDVASNCGESSMFNVSTTRCCDGRPFISKMDGALQVSKFSVSISAYRTLLGGLGDAGVGSEANEDFLWFVW